YDSRRGGKLDRARHGCRLVWAQRRLEETVVRTVELRRPDIFDAHHGGAAIDEAKELGRVLGDVENAVGGIGATVIDAHDQRAAVTQIGHPRVARQRHGRMRGGDGVEVENFAVWRGTTVEIVAV